MSLPELLYSGSVKNIHGKKDDETLFFNFTDKYSIFDWGEMPDHLENKGKCLAVMADLFFKTIENPLDWKKLQANDLDSDKFAKLVSSATGKKFCNSGAAHHNLGLVDNNGEKLAAGQVSKVLAVEALKVLRPEEKDNQFDYCVYHSKPEGCLVPLEVIFRFGAPKGSSLLRRVKRNPDYAKEIGIDPNVEEGSEFEWPILELTTKLEPSDRFLSVDEAKKMAGLTDIELQGLLDHTALLAIRLREVFSQQKIKLWDGKFEFGFTKKNSVGERDFKLVDSIGPDELRLTYEGVQLSKEIFRQFYKDSPWAKNVEKSKDLAKQRGLAHWKEICSEELKSNPGLLSADFKNFGQQMYQVLANGFAQHLKLPNPFDCPENLDGLIQKWNKL